MSEHIGEVLARRFRQARNTNDLELVIWSFYQLDEEQQGRFFSYLGGRMIALNELEDNR